jgi:hypothetical protein
MILLLQLGLNGSGKLFNPPTKQDSVFIGNWLELVVRQPYPLALVCVLLCVVVVNHGSSP